MLTEGTRRARKTDPFPVVPVRDLRSFPVRLQSQFVVSSNISCETSQRFRRLVAPEVCLASRGVIRTDLAAARSEPRNQVTATPVGATVFSVRAALKAAVDDLAARDKFIERPIAGGPGGKVLVYFGLDKSGTQSTPKVVLSRAKQATLLGHLGASGSMPCVWCCALVRPTATHVAQFDVYCTL